jgi:hypothetical protein
MKKIFTILLFLLLISNVNKTYAQGPSLGFDTLAVFPSFPDSVTLGDTVSITLVIKNHGNAPFSGPISLFTQIKDSTNTAVSLDSTAIGQVSIGSGTNFPFTYTEVYSIARNFFVGIDVVVIWPKAVGVPTHDSLKYIVTIYSPSSVSRMLVENGIQVFPNPFTDHFNVLDKAAQNKIERVSIYDIKGILIRSYFPNETVDLSSIPNAFYLVELHYKTGMRKYVKVQKQE